MQIRFQFSRGEDLKFIGHLDILRLFERAFKRSGLPVAHSQGFNPRPLIVFGQPMPLGLTSEGEFADVELDGTIDPADFLKKMNASLPPGIQLLAAKEKKSASNLMGLIAAARYRVEYEAGGDFDFSEAAEKVLAAETIPVMKKTKSGEKEIDIRPLLYELSGGGEGNNFYFDVLLGAGQNDNVRPELFLAGISLLCGKKLTMRRMHRIMLYGRAETQWRSLMDEALL